MIARVRIRLPFLFHIIEGDPLSPHDLRIEGFSVKLYPPYHSDVADAAIGGNTLDFVAAESPFSDNTKFDERRTAAANILQMDLAGGPFDRRNDSHDEKLIRTAFRAANWFVIGYRSVARASRVQATLLETARWSLRYLNDDGTELEPEEGLVRGRANIAFNSAGSLHRLARVDWENVKSLPLDFEPSPAETLLLDASLLLPHVGPALVLAATAIEIQIGTVLDVLATESTGVPPELWKWLNDRGDFRKEPSPVEQLDVLLRVLSGHSLKEEARLWDGFMNLKAIRNNFVHQGVAKPQKGEPVDVERARELIAVAKSVVTWIESRLPPERQHPTFPDELMTFSHTIEMR